MEKKHYKKVAIFVILVVLFFTILLAFLFTKRNKSDEDVQSKNSALRYVNVSDHPGELCKRKCIQNDHKVCYFHFVLEHYQTMGVACGECANGVTEHCNNPQCIVGDGTEKGVMSINRMIPGPEILVCKGDMLIVDVVNNAFGTAASLHWHGLHMRDTPFMDGVPFVTQCPIPFASTFRYNFWATEAGTHFYHSHSGFHKVNGQYGALIVREPDDDEANSDKYDFDLTDHYILISDWMHDYGENWFPGLPSSQGMFPNSLLINGRGTFIDPETMEHTQVPVTNYLVKPGKRYRLRVINSISNDCLVQFQVEGHRFSVISMDSYNVEAHSYDTLVLNSGERYDLVLSTNHTEGTFWIRVRPISLCDIYPLDGLALLRYENNTTTDDKLELQPEFPAYNETFPEGTLLNHPMCSSRSNSYCVSEFTALESNDDLLTRIPDQRFILNFCNTKTPNENIFRPGVFQNFLDLRNNITAISTVNNISMVFPSSPPLTQPFDVDELEYCNEWHWPDHCSSLKEVCFCTHRIKVQLNDIVEIVLVDDSPGLVRVHHPFHLHGYRFAIIAMGQHPIGLPPTEDQMMGQNKKPPFRDTVSIPLDGFAVIRFRADNPGYWILHCHSDWHLAAGMQLILQVGEQDQMVSAPEDFPKCKNYVPDIEEPNFSKV